MFNEFIVFVLSMRKIKIFFICFVFVLLYVKGNSINIRIGSFN